MCKSPPGRRCSDDTRGKEEATAEVYERTYPIGPVINATSAAAAAAAYEFGTRLARAHTTPRKKVTYALERYGLPPATAPRTNPTEDAVEEELFTASMWADTLPPAQVEAIRDYTADGYQDLNAHLARGTVDQLSVHYKQMMANLDAAVASAWRYPRTVYRGVRVPADWTEQQVEQHLAKVFPVGTSVRFPTFLSTSLHPSVATGFTRGAKAVVFEMRTTQGACIDTVSDMPGEMEVLLGRDTQWRVAGVSTKATTVTADLDGYRRVDAMIIHLVEESLVDEPSLGTAEGLAPVRVLEQGGAS